MSYQKLTALYFDSSTSPEEQTAYMKFLASLFPDRTAEFRYVRTVPMAVRVVNSRLFDVSIPRILAMMVDRYWGQADPPLPMVAGMDIFSNALQYSQNLRYEMHDGEAGLDFNYSRRQANYRTVDIDAQHYRSKSMLIQFSDGNGWFNEDQLRLIREQRLTMPDLLRIKRTALDLTR
jgi:hypothetical protein